MFMQLIFNEKFIWKFSLQIKWTGEIQTFANAVNWNLWSIFNHNKSLANEKQIFEPNTNLSESRSQSESYKLRQILIFIFRIENKS